jgi:hypothetical protein
MATQHSLAVFCAVSLVLAPATYGCASAPPEMSMRTKSTSAALLTGEEIRRNHIDNAYDAVRRLRPTFLSTRGPTSVIGAPRHDIVVIVNGLVYGGVEELRSLRSNEIAWMRRLSAAEAYIKIGHPAPSGGIELRLEPCPGGCR